MSYRIFTAVDIDPAVQRKVHAAAGGLPVGDASVNFVAADNIHLTLHFLGEVEDERLMDVHRAVEQAAAGAGALEFDVVGLRAVPPTGRLRMIWAGVTEPTGRLAALHKAVGHALQQAGFTTETRPFNPHLTLARVKSARNAEAIRAATAAQETVLFGTCRAEEIVVYSSQLTKKGPIYLPMGRAALAG